MRIIDREYISSINHSINTDSFPFHKSTPSVHSLLVSFVVIMTAAVLPESRESRRWTQAFGRPRGMAHTRELLSQRDNARRHQPMYVDNANAPSGRNQQQYSRYRSIEQQDTNNRNNDDDTMVYLTRSTQVVDWSIEHVTIQTETIGAFSLDRCSQLKSIRFNDNVPTIIMEANVFSRCASLTTIVFPASVQSIDKRVLAQCKSLKNLDMASCHNLQTWNTTQAFQKCTSLEQIRFPPTGMQTVGDNMMQGCTSLIVLTNLPSTVKRIGADALRDCTSLRFVSLPDSVQVVDDHAFAGCTALESMRLSRQLRIIGQGVWRKCCTLQRIEWPIVDDVPTDEPDKSSQKDDPRKLWAPFLHTIVHTDPRSRLPRRNQASVIYDFLQRHMNDISPANTTSMIAEKTSP